jgi:hypothetical protein
VGGPNSTQKQAKQIELQNAQQQQALAGDSATKFKSQYSDLNPFYTNEMNYGLPFFNNLTDYSSGDTSRAYAPAYGDLARRTASMGALPSGFKTGAINDLTASRANAFDSQLKQALFAQQQAKQQGAAGKAGLLQAVNPAAFYGGSTSAASGATQPLQAAPNPWLGIAGGVAQGAASAIPW